ncbi:hypothetical protein [Aeromonas finlandensis]|uniref:hypothetical protein n=1 Tax=Aeromonas finlandensis TaxID=1543375 RepID=UPI0012DFEABD|nr:hypothetical protein [Aeromonas finlandensis]
MTLPPLILVCMLLALSGICWQHTILRLLDNLGSWVMSLIDPLGLFLPVWGA